MGRGPNIKSVGSERKSELVIRQLRGLIEAGRLRPGEKLPAEPDLASRFGVSRTVLREALKVMELSGYLEVRRGYGGGTFVAKPAAEEFKAVSAQGMVVPAVTSLQLRQVRLAIEPQAAGLAARAEEVREARALRDAMRQMEVFDDRPARVLEANAAFHVAVAKVSGNPVFVAVLEGLRSAVYRDLNHSVRDPAWREACRGEHEAVVRAIESGDHELAERTMRRHLENELGIAGRGKEA